jgi:hypothetical protein
MGPADAAAMDAELEAVPPARRWRAGMQVGAEKAVITDTRDISPGLVRQALDRMECLPEGWLL